MIRSLFTAASGMLAQQLNLDNIANNLANASTAGFRRRRLQFQDLLYQNMIMPGSAATSQTTVAAGLQIGLGTRPSASEIVQTQGDFAATGNPLDLTVEGLGFFQVHLPNGDTAYTRSGAFHLDAQGNVVTAEGDPIEPQSPSRRGRVRSALAQSVSRSRASKLRSKWAAFSWRSFPTPAA